MSQQGLDEIKALEQATEIQRLFHQSEELKRQYRAAPNCLKAAQIMNEASKLDARIRELVDENNTVDSNGNVKRSTNLKPVADAVSREREAHQQESDTPPTQKPFVSHLQSMATHAHNEHHEDIKGRIVNVASGLLKPFVTHDEEPEVPPKTAPPFEQWILNHLARRRKVDEGHGTEDDANPNCSLGRWIARHRDEGVDELAEKHAAFHQAIRDRLETGKTDTSLARACNGLLIALSKAKTSWTPQHFE